MLKQICLALVAASLAFPAYAAGCKPFDKSKAPAGVKFTTLTGGQTHFVQGAYVAAPSTPAGPPPGDGAVLLQLPHDGGSVVLFTSRRGSLVCQMMSVPAGFVQILLKVGTGRLEDVVPPEPPAPSHDDELKL